MSADQQLRVVVAGHGSIGRQRAAAIALAARAPVTLASTVDPPGRDLNLYDGVPRVTSLEDLPAGSSGAAIVALPHDTVVWNPREDDSFLQRMRNEPDFATMCRIDDEFFTKV